MGQGTPVATRSWIGRTEGCQLQEGHGRLDRGTPGQESREEREISCRDAVDREREGDKMEESGAAEITGHMCRDWVQRRTGYREAAHSM